LVLHEAMEEGHRVLQELEVELHESQQDHHLELVAEVHESQEDHHLELEVEHLENQENHHQNLQDQEVWVVAGTFVELRRNESLVAEVWKHYISHI